MYARWGIFPKTLPHKVEQNANLQHELGLSAHPPLKQHLDHIMKIAGDQPPLHDPAAAALDKRAADAMDQRVNDLMDTIKNTPYRLDEAVARRIMMGGSAGASLLDGFITKWAGKIDTKTLVPVLKRGSVPRLDAYVRKEALRKYVEANDIHEKLLDKHKTCMGELSDLGKSPEVRKSPEEAAYAKTAEFLGAGGAVGEYKKFFSVAEKHVPKLNLKLPNPTENLTSSIILK